MKHRQTAKRTLNLPRAPLPRQTGGVHRTRKNELDRKVKHRRDYRHDSE